MKPVKCVCGGSAVEYLQLDQAIICWVCPREVRGYTPIEAILMWNAAQKELKKKRKVKK